jgi:ribosomal protein S6--L-glutamate ligase
MRLVSFDPLRTYDLPGVCAVRPENWIRSREEILAADWVLFPETWQVNALYYGWKKRIFPSLASYHIGYSKIEMTRAFDSVCPESVPITRIVASTDTGIAQILDEFCFPFVVKDARSSMGEGVRLVRNRAEFREFAASHPVLYVQEYLPIQRDLRVVVVGSSALAAYWRQAPEGGFHNNVARGGRISFEDVPLEAVRLVERVSADLGIDHAGFDVAVLEDRFYLLEFNVRFGHEALRERGIRIGPRILEVLRGRPATASGLVRGEPEDRASQGTVPVEPQDEVRLPPPPLRTDHRDQGAAVGGAPSLEAR